MRTKRYIALLLTAIYLFAVGGPSLAALTCRCNAPAHSVEWICCRQCGQPATDAKAAMQEPCCDDLHSTDIELYTASSHDSEKSVKRIVVDDLPDALASETVVSAGPLHPVGSDRLEVRGSGAVPDSFVSSCGLRAPPVLV